MGRIDLDLNGIGREPRSRAVGSDSHGWHGFNRTARRILEGLIEMGMAAEWLKVGLPVLAAVLSAYVMIQGHDIKINRLESDMKAHTLEHKQEAKENSEKLSRIEIAVERIETKLEATKGR